MTTNIPQTQQYQYFYIDRKLSHHSQLQILSGLQSLQTFIPEIKKIQILDSIMMRILDLFKNNHHYYIKVKSSSLLAKFSHKIQIVHSKDEILITIPKLLRSHDPFTRIMTIKTISTMPNLFTKDISVYHILLNKLQPQNCDKTQRIQAYNCLKSFLSQSKYLSTLYSKSLSQIIKYSRINGKILLGLCISSNFKPIDYIQIIDKLKNAVILNCSIMKKLFIKLYSKFLKQNYFMIEKYKNQYRQLVPQLQQTIKFFQNYYFIFLRQYNGQYKIDFTQPKKQILDTLFYIRKNGQFQLLNQTQLELYIKQCIKNHQMNHQIILMSFYLISIIDQQIENWLESFNYFLNNQKYLFLILKICLVSGNYNTANIILNKLLQNQNFISYSSLLIFFKLYCSFHIQKEDQKQNLLLRLYAFISLQFQNSRIQQLCLMWLQQYQIQKNNQSQMKDQTISLNNILCQQQIEFMRLIKNKKYTHGNKNIHLIPGNHLNNQRKSTFFVYLGKQTILSLFHELKNKYL